MPEQQLKRDYGIAERPPYVADVINALAARLSALEAEYAKLKQELADLKKKVG